MFNMGSSGAASATDGHIVNPQDMQKWSRPEKC